MDLWVGRRSERKRKHVSYVYNSSDDSNDDRDDDDYIGSSDDFNTRSDDDSPSVSSKPAVQIISSQVVPSISPACNPKQAILGVQGANMNKTVSLPETTTDRLLSSTSRRLQSERKQKRARMSDELNYSSDLLTGDETTLPLYRFTSLQLLGEKKKNTPKQHI